MAWRKRGGKKGLKEESIAYHDMDPPGFQRDNKIMEIGEDSSVIGSNGYRTCSVKLAGVI